MRRTRWAWLAVALLATLALPWSRLHAAPPSNDAFNNRIVLSATGASVSVQGSNANASKQNGEPDHAANPGGRSVWWAWTAPTNGDLTITTDHSDFDTLLGVYTGSSVSALSPVVSNDDHGVVVTSRARFPAVAGTQYQIAVDGFNDSSGAESGSINLSLDFVPGPIVRPPNDNFTNRIFLSGSSVTAAGSNVNATRETGEPLHAAGDGDTSAWWSWTAPATDTVRITTEGSTIDTLLGIYAGSLVWNLTEVASNDDADPASGVTTSTVIFDVAGGQEYQVAVDGYDGEAGQLVLSIESMVPRLGAPAWLANGLFQFTVSGATGTTNEIQGSEDLRNWTSLGTITNTSGTTSFADTTATNFTTRFYRALLR